MKRQFSGPEMKALGLDEPWESNDNIKSVRDTVGSHGTCLEIVFEFENKLWMMDCDYYHEDWEGTSDICCCITYGSGWCQADEVIGKEVLTTVYEKV